MPSRHEPATASLRPVEVSHAARAARRPDPLSVVIVGGGFAALEAALALRALVADRVTTTVLGRYLAAYLEQLTPLVA